MKHVVTPLHERISATAPLIVCSSAEQYLKKYIRSRLKIASDEGRLDVGIHDISRHVRITKNNVGQDAFELIGGRRNFPRTPDLGDLRTPDGGWLSFAAILRPKDRSLEVLGYTFERVFGPKSEPRWVRFDLNESGHPNEGRGLRSHVHPGNDDLQLPAPIFAPHELVDIMLRDIQPPGGRKRRRKG